MEGITDTKGGTVMNISKAQPQDLAAILELQYLAFRSEAIRHNDFNIRPMRQTLAEVQAEHECGVILKAVDERGAIVGSVRGHSEGGTLYVGKLIVHPDMEGRGLGTRLLTEIERHFPPQRCELFTVADSERNIGLYERAGYIRFRVEEHPSRPRMVYLEKSAAR